MELGRVRGRLVATQRADNLDGVKFLIVQPLNERLDPVGSPLVAVDGVAQAGPGDLVYWVKGREGAMVLPEHFACVDAGIAGIVDAVDLEEEKS
ncbi:MAG: EutN/CcmL family microcompartment protein [Pseudomonadota bacterium]